MVSSRLMFLLGLATLVLIYAAGTQDRGLIRDLVRRLDGPFGGLVLVLLMGKGRDRVRLFGAGARPSLTRA